MLKPSPAPRYAGRKPGGSVGARLTGALRKVAEAGKGNRNIELNKQAHLLGRMIVEDGLTEGQAEAMLLEAGLTANPEYGRKATLATIRSGLKKGMAHAGGRR